MKHIKTFESFNALYEKLYKLPVNLTEEQFKKLSEFGERKGYSEDQFNFGFGPSFEQKPKYKDKEGNTYVKDQLWISSDVLDEVEEELLKLNIVKKK